MWLITSKHQSTTAENKLNLNTKFHILIFWLNRSHLVLLSFEVCYLPNNQWCAEKRKFPYFDWGAGTPGTANRDVVKLEVDFHCEKKPSCFPFSAEANQRFMRSLKCVEHDWIFNI